jgi:hypothetical protein
MCHAAPVVKVASIRITGPAAHSHGEDVLGPLADPAYLVWPCLRARAVAQADRMSPDPTRNLTPREEPQPAALPAPAEPAESGYSFWTAERACCCPAKPAVVAVLPPGPGRDHPTDLLLCGHHYRASRQALELAGATVLAEGGLPAAR